MANSSLLVYPPPAAGVLVELIVNYTSETPRAHWPLKNWLEYDQSVISALQELSTTKPGMGFWKRYRRLRRRGHDWNHKRLHRVYCELKSNIRRRAKKRVPTRDPQPLMVPLAPNQV